MRLKANIDLYDTHIPGNTFNWEKTTWPLQK